MWLTRGVVHECPTRLRRDHRHKPGRKCTLALFHPIIVTHLLSRGGRDGEGSFDAYHAHLRGHGEVARKQARLQTADPTAGLSGIAHDHIYCHGLIFSTIRQDEITQARIQLATFLRRSTASQTSTLP